MSDKPAAKPIQAWSVKIDGLYDSRHWWEIQSHAQDSLDHCARDSGVTPSSDLGEVIPVTITEGHGDELERVRRELNKIIKSFTRNDDSAAFDRLVDLRNSVTPGGADGLG